MGPPVKPEGQRSIAFDNINPTSLRLDRRVHERLHVGD